MAVEIADPVMIGGSVYFDERSNTAKPLNTKAQLPAIETKRSAAI
jgi:hypothetical protein